jgi:hypothetical protein
MSPSETIKKIDACIMLDIENIKIWKQSPNRNTRFARESIEYSMLGIKFMSELKTKINHEENI